MLPKNKSKTIHKQLELLSQELSIRDFSDTTIKAYRSHLKQFLLFSSSTLEYNLDLVYIKEYLQSKVIEKAWSSSTQLQAIKAIQYYCKYVAPSDIDFSELKLSVDCNLPDILDKEEILMILSQSQSLKYRCMITLLFTCGLHLRELLNLKREDLDLENKLLTIKISNGSQRKVVISDFILDSLKNYLYDFGTNGWLFEGKNGLKITARGVEKMFKKIISKLKIDKHITPATFRHSCGVHLIECGIDLLRIQKFMGHKSTKSSKMYLLLAKQSKIKIRPPFQFLNVK